MAVTAAFGIELGTAQPQSHRVVVPMAAADKDVVLLEGPTPYPANTRTGVSEVDIVLDAIESESPDALTALFEPVFAPCVVDPLPMSLVHVCPEGVPSGTPVPKFRAEACEPMMSAYVATVLPLIWQRERPLLAIYRDPTDAYSWLPAADYAIIVSRGPKGPEQDHPFVVRVADGRVNGVFFGCGHTFAQLTDGIELGRYLLPPRHWP